MIALGVTVLLGVVYLVFIRDGGGEETAETRVALKTEATLQTERILSNINEIESYPVLDTLFEDARFRSLQDYRVDIADVDTGRANPFEPVE